MKAVIDNLATRQPSKLFPRYYVLQADRTFAQVSLRFVHGYCIFHRVDVRVAICKRVLNGLAQCIGGWTMLIASTARIKDVGSTQRT